MWFEKFGLASRALIPRAQFRTAMHIFKAQQSFSNYIIRYTDQMTETWSSTTTFIGVNIRTNLTVITVGRDGKFVLLCGVELGQPEKIPPSLFYRYRESL